MRKLSTLLLLIAVLGSLVGQGARPAAAAGRIDPGLAAKLQAAAPGEQIAVIVQMADRVDARAVGGANRRLRRQKLALALRLKADQTQAPLRRSLAGWRNSGEVTAFAPLWGINAIAVTGTAAVIQVIAASPGVSGVTPDATLSAPPPPASGSLPTPSLAAINAPALWALGYYGQGVVVASLDSGVDASHPDLAPRYRGGSNSWFDPYGQHSTPYDQSGHGTWTMGVMVGGDSIGYVVGAAPQATWIAAKIFNDGGTATTSAIHQAFQWVLDPDGNPSTDDGPDVVNNSWTASTPGCDQTFAPDLQNLLAAEILPVFAAGNGGPAAGSAPSPASLPGAFAVGALDETGAVLGMSARGPSACDGAVFPAISAPGANVITTDLYGGYFTPTGTSLAAPQVSGGLALLLSAFPGLTAAQQRAALLQGAIDLGDAGPDNNYGVGKLDLLASYQLLAGGAASAPTSTPVPPTATNTNTAVPPTATRTSTPIPPTATSTAAPPTATTTSGMIFADDFESGNLSRWSSSATNKGRLSVTSAAALAGTRGMQAQISGTTQMYVADTTPAAEAAYRARFHFDPNSIAASNGKAHNLLVGLSTSGATVFRVQFGWTSTGGYRVRAGLRTNSGGEVFTGWSALSDAPHTVEVLWQAASSGGLTLWLDGGVAQTSSGVANGQQRVDEVRLGPTTIGSGFNGTEYYDSFASSRGGTITP